MNKSYKILWNESLQDWVVAGEFASGKKKTKTSRLIRAWKASLIGSAAIASVAAHAADIDVQNVRPEDHASVIQISGDTNLTGSFKNIATGEKGYDEMSFRNAVDGGYIADGAQYVDEGNLKLGSQNKIVTYTDAAHVQRSVKVYDNTAMSNEPIAGFEVKVTKKGVAADAQYVDKKFYSIDGAGNQLTVSVGKDNADWATSAANRAGMILKGTKAGETTSAVFDVSNGGTVNYDTKTIASLGNELNVDQSQRGRLIAFQGGFTGDFKSAIGDWSVTTFEEFQQYNSALIEAVTQGKLTQEQYNKELDKARQTDTKTVTGVQIAAAGDALYQQVGDDRIAFILADGQQTTVNVNQDATIQLYNSEASVVKLQNGATLNNDGNLGSFANDTRGSTVVNAVDATVNNRSTGVIDVGTNSDMAVVSGTYASGKGTGINAKGSSAVHNDGVINVAPRPNAAPTYGIIASGNSMVDNTGNINLAALEQLTGSNGTSYSSIGTFLLGNARFTNQGNVNIGLSAQRALTDEQQAVTVATPGAVGVYLGKGGTFINDTAGTITIGKNTTGAVAIDAIGANAHVNSLGNIIINTDPDNGKKPAESIAIKAEAGATDVVNAGTISLNGVNSVGMLVKGDGKSPATAAVLSSTGVIDINHSLDPFNHVANYGMWVEGENASSTLQGQVNLNGDGVVGVHARNGGVVNVDGGDVNFVSGSGQTGYYIYGVGSTVNNTASSQTVSTADSTLYRIDSGAAYSSAGDTMTASGDNSTLLLATGVSEDGNTRSKIDTAGMTLNVTGKGATAIRVEGGAQATIDANTKINLSAPGAVAGLVQGASTSIVGTSGHYDDSELTSAAILNSENVAAEAMGYKVLTGGTLNHSGIINLTAEKSTGVQINGGTLNNTKNISVNGTAVDIIGENSEVNNTGEITATNGRAAFRLSDGASLDLTGSGTTHASGSAHGILLDEGAKKLTVKDTTITLDPISSDNTADTEDKKPGNGIENKAEIADIQLDNTTINVNNGGAGVRTSASLAQSNSGVINVIGSGTGLLFQNADGSMTDNAYDMSQSQALVVNVNSAEGRGMTTNTSGDIKTGVSVNVNDASGGSALVIGGQTAHVEQSGLLASASATQMVDINNGHTTDFVNSGTIASTAADALVMNVDKQAVHFTNQANGNLTGAVNLLSGNNTVTLEHGSQAKTAFTTGAGDDLFELTNITAEENPVLFTTLDGGAGHNTLALNNSVYTLKDADKIQHMSDVELKKNSTFTLDHTQLDLTAADAGWNIDSTSTLAMQDSTDLDFASHLQGDGLVTVDLGGQDHTFAFTDNNKADGFAGTVELTNSHFVLDGATTANNQALSDATLKLGEGSITDVAKGTQQIGGLAFNGGTAVFDTDTVGKSVSDAYITTTGNLDISGTGNVQVNTDSPVFNGPVMPDNAVNLLAQDDGDISLKLAGSTGSVSAYGGNLTLLDRNGNAVTDAVSSAVMQNGETVANATYDYRLTSGDNSDGLYINYGLTKVELLTSGDNALTLNAQGATGAAADLSALVTGAGDLAIDGGAGNTVSLSNLANDYTGKTDVRSGTLLANNDNVLGQTSELHQAADTTVDLNGHSQSVGLLNTDAGANTDFNGGSLTTANGGTVNGGLTGNGALAVNGGTLTINGANAQMNAATTIANGATVELNDIAGLGSAAIVDNGLLALNEGVQGLLSNSLTGSGDVDKNGSGLVTMTADAAQYTGTTNLNAGGLQLGSNGNDVILASSTVNVAQGAQFGGFGGTAGDVNNLGTLTVGNVAPQVMALREMTDEGQTFTIGHNLSNSGVINVSAPGSTMAGNTLHVAGDYAGNGGTLNLNTQLGGDNSLTDKLVVDGNTSGTTQVAVTNAGGSGAKTLNGIEVVSVGGNSAGEFTQKGRIVAGAYDYTLARGQGDNAGNWYLTNNGETPVDPVNPVNPDNGGDTPDNGGGDKPHTPDIRPEGKAYASNMQAANTLFNMTLHDRLGETHYVDALGQEQTTSLWLRQVGGHNRSNDGSGQNKTQSNRYVAQLGGDIAQWSSDGADRFHLGVMAGYANQHSNTRNHRNGYSADGSVSGYSTGLYGTWFQDNEEKTGAYVDTWMLYNWFDNSVSSKGASSESYKSKGLTASVETGYTWKVGERNDHESYYVQPQAQVTWMGVKADDHKEQNGTVVQFGGDDNVQTRLGARFFIKGHNAKLDNGKDRTFEPFIEANWIHNTKDFTAGLDGVPVKVAGTRNIGELKTGVEAKLNKNVNLWGNIAQQIGDKGYSDTQAMVGFKVNF
ncbi:TPA: autotransporter outer membrane beta-barrel domain-containing protein [Klebsiella aerogenes]|uniref:autotransporter outer membrane beta-barrel domain-containing protein n=6 Tax=Klebsiella aerogenes TaxID=548 RepID=UPI0038905A81|nr:autotransporter outer membrane beta-barrel domain-containing protein [Klebsiella aerogenes]HCB2881603.1 autotransporter outer membrane beta-barrel domain-containing protein [Klebsiella aerogenes]